MGRWRYYRRGMFLGSLLVLSSPLVVPTLAQASTAATWQNSATATGISNISWLSCSAARQCDAYGGGAIAAEVSGTWNPPVAVANLPTGATIGAVACPEPTDCVVGGSVGGQSFLITETSGIWGTAQLIVGTAEYTEGTPSLYGLFTSSITAISCVAAGECTAAGNYTVHLSPSATLAYSGPGFATTLTLGTWSAATALNGIDAVTAIDCVGVSTCLVGGYATTFRIFVYYPIVTNTAVTVTETRSAWGSAAAVGDLTNLGRKTGWIDSQVTALSCVSAGNCTIGGNDEYAPDFDGNPVSLYNSSFHGFVAREVRGAWGAPTELTDVTGVASVACSSISHCVTASGHDVYLENAGTWSGPRELRAASHVVTLGAVACWLAGSCLVAGVESGSTFAFVARAGAWSSAQHLAGLSAVSGASCPSADACSVSGGSKVIRQI